MARKAVGERRVRRRTKADPADTAETVAATDRLAAPPISARLAGAGPARAPAPRAAPASWSITGELALNCSCEVFCPCVVSLGQHPPTNGYCQAWVGIRIDEGHADETPLAGVNVAMLLDIPGRMAEGGWTVALYIDDGATDDQVAALEHILSGQAGGTTGLFRLLVANFLGTRRVPVTYAVENGVRTLQAGRAILASIRPIDGAEPGQPVAIENTSYWMGPRVIIARGLKSKLRDFGRVWTFDDCSAELCDIRWRGP